MRMDRRHLIELLKRARYTFDLDFTDDFLNTFSIRQLRHIAMAVRPHITDELDVADERHTSHSNS